jgi:uncharacterized membrane protein
MSHINVVKKLVKPFSSFLFHFTMYPVKNKHFYQYTYQRRTFIMAAAAVLIMILYAIIGGVSTLAMVIGIPAVIIWKIYRKIVFHTSIYA